VERVLLPETIDHRKSANGLVWKLGSVAFLLIYVFYCFSLNFASANPNI
jgi:hypothetical protein